MESLNGGKPILSEPASASTKSSWWKRLGPGLITGAADDDPSGIATYSQVGAQFGFGLLWTIPLTYPLMVAIQVICARIGRISGHGLASNIRQHYPRPIIYGVVVLLLIANTINIGADISAMGAAVWLVAGGPAIWYGAALGIGSLLLQVFVPYRRYVHILKWLTLALLAYIATAFVVHTPWLQVLREAIHPRLMLNREYLTALVALFGTTISPYLFFWQASEEVEEMHTQPGAKPLKSEPQQAERALQRIGLDTWIGMGFSNLVAFFIILTAAAMLHAQGVTRVESTAQAATALAPIAGESAALLFACGIIGTGLLAVPVLAGSAAYAVAGAFQWQSSLAHAPAKAKKFYLTIAAAMVGGIALSFSPIDPMRALYWSAALNGVVSVPVMVLVMLLASRREVMGRLRIGAAWRWLGWLTTALMAAAAAAMLWTSV